MKTTINRLLTLAVIAAASSITAMAVKPLVVAHRGYWKAEGSAQNSIRAIAKADSVKCFGSEFDVWVTADGVVVVNHDPSINDVVIETSNADEVLAQTLSNGEHVPTLEAYLQEAVKYPDLQLVCELKPHTSNWRETVAINEILRLMKEYNLENRVDYITFSKNGFKKLIKNAPQGTAVYYLDGDYVPEQIKFMGGAGIDYSIGAIRNHPEWIKQSHDLGLKVNVWTVNKTADMQWCIDNGVDFITTNEPEKLQRLLDAK
ncbi:MAG: glycerophosphodiester phosphodiesterase [Muribaculaceae bacterium]|nr:glycerophosphodiester phosphodiesterase [Muribaculaceae bacterium]